MNERVFVVTGGSGGIGLETARGLARRGARVRLVGRNPQKTEAAVRAVRQVSTGGDVAAFRADFSSLDDVRRLADELLARDEPLHVLINNAGVWHQERKTSADGFEDTFAVNHLAPFLLTHLLLPRMLQTDGDRRIVHVSSRLHEQAGLSGVIGRAVYMVNIVGIPLRVRSSGIDLDELQRTNEPNYRGLEAYSRSKLAQILFSNELARRLRTAGVCSNALHPGSVATNVTRDNRLLSLGTRLAGPLLKTPAQGAATSLHLATAAGLRGVSGRYFAECAERKPARTALDVQAARRLWDLSLRMTGLPETLLEAVSARRR